MSCVDLLNGLTKVNGSKIIELLTNVLRSKSVRMDVFNENEAGMKLKL